MVCGIVDVQTQLLEVGDDDEPRAHMLALVAEGLRLNLREVGGLVVFQLYHAYHLAVQQDGPVSLLGVGLVLLLRYQIIVRRRIQHVAQHLHKQFAKEALLELLLLRLTYVLLYCRVQEILPVPVPGLLHQLLGQHGKVLLYDILLK